MKTSWIRLSSLSSEDVFKTSSRRFDQDECTCLSHTSSEDILKTFWSRLDQDQYIRLGQNIFKTSSRRFEDVFKTYTRCLTKMSSRRLQNVFKTPCKNVFKTSSRRCCYLLKTSSRPIQHVSDTYCKDSYLQKDLPRPHFREIYGQCAKFARVIKISQALVFLFTALFSGCLQRRI